MSADRLRHQFETPGIDVTQGLWVLPAQDGDLIGACAALPLPGGDGVTVHMNVAVRPDHRGEGVEESLLHFAESRATEKHTDSSGPLALMAHVMAHQRELIRLYEDSGYRPTRWFMQLERHLSQPIEHAPVPDGIGIRDADRKADAESLYTAIHDSFKDHWNPPEFSLEQFRHGLAVPGFVPGLALLAFDPAGEPAGACMANVREEYNRQHGTHEGYIGTVGVRRPYRRRGLARALLTQAMQSLSAAGMTVAVLDVDADSPTGAMRLYESVGFRERRRSVVYHKVIDA